MPRKNSPEPWADEYIKEHYATGNTAEIAKHIGRTERHVRGRAHELGVKKLPQAKGLRKSVLFTPEMDRILLEHYPHKTNREISEMLGGMKPRSFTPRALALGVTKTKETLNRTYVEAMAATGKGRKGQFKKGNKPWNDGIKGYTTNGQRGHFKNGNKPPTWVPVGTERLSTNAKNRPDASRYLRRKVAEPDVWKLVHHIVWEDKFGPIPEGHVVIFKDGNSRNFDPDNLDCIPRKDLSLMNATKLPAEYLPIFHISRELEKAINEKESP